MRRMDSEMLLEVPDTPERLPFARSVGESSSLTRGIEDKPSSSNQCLEPAARNYSHNMKNSGLYRFDGNNAAPMDGHFMLSHSSINQVISGTNETRTIHSTDCSSEPVRSGFLNDDNRTNPEMIDLSQESPFSLARPTRHRGSRHKEDKHLSMHNEGTEVTRYGKFDVHDFNGDNAVPVDDDFLFQQAKVARFFCGTHDTGTTHSHDSSHELGRGTISNAWTGADMIDLSNGSPSPLPHPTIHSGPRNKERNYLRRQSERNEMSCYGKLGLRALNSTEGHGKEKSNASNSSKAFGSSNNITVTENIRCLTSVVPTHKELKDPGSERAPPSLVRNQDIEIGIESHMVSQATNGKVNHNHLDIILPPRKNGHRMLVRNGCISPSNIARSKKDTKAKGIEVGIIASKMPCTSYSTQVDDVFHSKSKGRRILANDGCISPYYIARNNNDANSSDCEGKGKGKQIMNEELLANSHHNGTIPSSRSGVHRSCLTPGKELSVISEMVYDTSRKTNGRGATHTHVESSSIIPTPFATGKCKSEENMPSHSSSCRVEKSKDTTHAQGYSKLVSEAPHHTGKRKNSFVHSNAGECSSSRTSSDWRSTKPSNSRLIRSRKSGRVDTTLAPIVEINELVNTTKEESHELSDDYIAKSIQLESDEILARQLQEQFYLESPPVGETEVESSVEWTLLEEGADLQASFRRQDRSFQREAFLPYLLGRPRVQHPSARMTARSRNRTENRIDRLRRNINRSSMSLEERLDFLEVLETAFENANDMATPDHFLDGGRDFDENDYEMLLALDDNNHHLGASERQINNLPQSLIQNTDFEELCAVCLETPSVGDTIRHLPCLHKFHKDCIDTWLRRKRSCPICKCGIT